nr:hydrogenase 4 subunit F [Candidatus Sigynarchaeota archaeon]
MLYLVLIPSIATAIACYLLKNKKRIELVNEMGACAEFLCAVLLCGLVVSSSTMTIGDNGLWYMDALSAYFLVIVAIVGSLAAFYSVGYLDYEYKENVIDVTRLRIYYSMFHLFIGMMMFVFITDNLTIVWIAIEGTTIASALLVAFYNKKPALEAAWKFIIICSAGIVLALFGTIIMSLNSNVELGESIFALNWTKLFASAGLLDPGLLKLTFILIFVGYATKAGLVPMHTWLPDAHSQAPSPVSATLSGVLLNCALYAILRYHAIMTKAHIMILGTGFSNLIMIIFGSLSLLVAAGFIVVSKDYKRILAYSSIKHIGMIILGFGIGNLAGTLAIFGALFHILNHSLTKSMLFFSSGNILLKYKTRCVDDIRGLGSTMPLTAILFMLGVFALTGLPPFSVFVSEISILSGMIQVAQLNPAYYITVFIYLLCMVIVFAGFTNSAGKMVFGTNSINKIEARVIVKQGETEHECSPTEQERPKVTPGEINRAGSIIVIILLVLILLLGVYMLPQMGAFLNNIATLF